MNFPDEKDLGLIDQTPTIMPSITNQMKVLNTTQTLSFPIPIDDDNQNSVEVNAANVIVNSVGGKHNHGSSKIKLKNIVDYNWEHRLYAGQLLAVHRDGNFLAYGIKVPSSGSNIWMVRVTHPSSENRALIKGMKGQVQDLAFACISTQVILGCIDEESNIFIHNIELGTSGLGCNLMLHIPGCSEVGLDHRIIWCPYIPDVDDPDNSSKLLLTTHGNKVSIWNIDRMATEYLKDPLTANLKPNMVLAAHTAPVVDAAFSPDGTALATASRDGFVKFFQAKFLQVYKHSETLRCLHTWTPHGGKPLSCLFFLDNHSGYSTEQLWRHALTGADNNMVLKIWSCQSWQCLQTITFAPSPEFPFMGCKAGLDRSASYLLLSDIYRKVLFILQLDSSDDTGLLCKSISEFFLPYPILSFGVADAGLRTFKCPSSCSDPFHLSNRGQSQSSSPIDDDHSNDENNEDSMLPGNGEGVPGVDGCNVCAVIRIYLVQPKSLQEGLITFNPPRINTSIRLADLDNATLGYNEDSIDVELDKELDLSSISIPPVDKFSHDNENGNERKSSIPNQPNKSLLAQQSQQLKNLLMHHQPLSMSIMKSEAMIMSGNLKKPPSPTSLLQTNTVSVSASQPPINLMTPDAFSSPAKRDEEDPPIAHSPDIRLPAPPSLMDNDINLNLLNSQINIDAPTILNPEPVMPMTNNSRVFPLNPPQPAVCEAKFASGGSSPSREVQEILSLKGSDCFYEDDLEEELNSQSPRSRTRVSPTAVDLCQNNSNQSAQEGFQLYNAPDKKMYISPRIDHPVKLNSSKRSTGSVEASPTQWPSIDMAKINEANQRKANSDKSSIQSKSNNNLNLSATMDMSENEDALSPDDDGKDPVDGKKADTKQSGQMKAVCNQLTKLVDILNDQQIEISLLRGEVSSFRRQQNAITAAQNSDEAVSTAKLVEQALQKNQVQLKQMIDATIASRADSDRVNREALLSGVSQMMGAQMAERLSAVVSHETRTSLVPCVERVLDPIVRSIQLELARKLSATDHLLTENIQKLVNSKSVMDGLCTAVSQTLSVSTKDAFKEVINMTLIPNMEKAHNQMFKQLNKSFSVGTEEYLSAFEACTKRSLERANVINETCTQVTSVTIQLQHILDQQNKQHILNTQTQQAVKQLNNLTKELQTVIPKTLQGAFENQMSPIRECIRDQISTGMAAHVAQLEDSVLLAVRSQSQTPAPTVIDMQTQQSQIEQLINTGQLNTAFQQALSASDLRLVVHACAYAEPRQVFSQPCPLQQNVLLSLIQQLGADMNSDTLLKHKYLEEAVMNLDQKNPVTREHMPAVLKELKKHLSTFISVNPYNEATHNLKVLILMTDGFIKTGLNCVNQE